MNANIPDLLSRSDIAERTHSCLRTVDKILNGPNGPRITKIGSRVFVRSDDFAAWLDRLAAAHATQAHKREAAV